jgi:hypothetical protein
MNYPPDNYFPTGRCRRSDATNVGYLLAVLQPAKSARLATSKPRAGARGSIVMLNPKAVSGEFDTLWGEVAASAKAGHDLAPQ